MIDISEVEKEVVLIGNFKNALRSGEHEELTQAIDLLERNWSAISASNKKYVLDMERFIDEEG